MCSDNANIQTLLFLQGSFQMPSFASTPLRPDPVASLQKQTSNTSPSSAPYSTCSPPTPPHPPPPPETLMCCLSSLCLTTGGPRNSQTYFISAFSYHSGKEHKSLVLLCPQHRAGSPSRALPTYTSAPRQRTLTLLAISIVVHLPSQDALLIGGHCGVLSHLEEGAAYLAS